RCSVEISYHCEPRRNIALARNKAVGGARGAFIAFIDDDEFPQPDWLATMVAACERLDAAGVLGPVRPHFEQSPPDWIVKGRFCERPEYPTGRLMSGSECRTGNVLFRREIIADLVEPFDPAFGSGGEDVDFFQRLIGRGRSFRWCNEGAVYETVPKERLTRGYFLRRALLRGRNNLKLPGRAQLVAKSCVAAPIYLTILPFTLLGGQHVFMKYAIKLSDHAGRLLTVLGINPVSER
ncbi:MAG: glycosyltransferase, partial [Methylocystis sp.]|nr:glycosyltransferase [Methylocystis sp.]